MLKDALITALFKIGCIQFGEFQLKSGEVTPVYVNLRKIISSPDILRMIATAMWEKTRACQYDVICGVPYTALPIATCISLEHDIPMIMRRKEKKDYGTKQMIEGLFQKGQKCLIIEDVITSGASIVETAADLEKEGLVITDVVALIDREQGGMENLRKKYTPHAIMTLPFILETLMKSNALNEKEQKLALEFLG